MILGDFGADRYQELKKRSFTMKLIIYGAGEIARKFYSEKKKYILNHNINGVFFAVSDNTNIIDHYIDDVLVCQIDEYAEEKNNIEIVIAVSKKYKTEVISRLKELHFQHYCYYTDESAVYQMLIGNSIEDIRRGLAFWYLENTNMELNWNKLVTFNEKIQWLKLYDQISLKTYLSDKILVRKYVSSKIGDKYIIPVYGCWNQAEDIDYKALPSDYVLKCNHGSGMNIIIREKIKDENNVRLKLNGWLGINYAYKSGFEMGYASIKPMVFAETYMENRNNDLFDYKFWCFNGKVEFIMFLSQRQNSLQMDNFDRGWNHLNFTYNYPNSGLNIEKPSKLNEMIEIAETLAKGFVHVRVDLYLFNDGTIKFGEMTFSSASGVCRWSDFSVNEKLGKLISLPNTKGED